MNDCLIPFNRPYMTGNELTYIKQAHVNGHLSGDGPFTKECQNWIENRAQCQQALLTHSCTAALEMAALLFDIKAGDEIIMPSYTFVSTANAFVLRGGIPVFVDIRADTLNLDETLLEEAITPRTRAIVPVHYAGVACEMDSILSIAKLHHLKVVEDAAQGIMADYKGKALGSIGDVGTFSFHETKNVISGEGGALLINNPQLGLKAEIIREKGTNRNQFFRGEVNKYTWQGLGSSYLPNELTAAFLWAQLQQAELITSRRLTSWQYYNDSLESLALKGIIRRPIIPDNCQHNAHMYYIILDPKIDRQLVLEHLKQNGIGAVFHYVPLHSSPSGQHYGRTSGDLKWTNSIAEQLIRLPLWHGITETEQHRVIDVLESITTDLI